MYVNCSILSISTPSISPSVGYLKIFRFLFCKIWYFVALVYTISTEQKLARTKQVLFNNMSGQSVLRTVFRSGTPEKTFLTASSSWIAYPTLIKPQFHGFLEQQFFRNLDINEDKCFVMELEFVFCPLQQGTTQKGSQWLRTNDL